MKYTQFLCFEICKECNLAKQHKKCPANHPARWGNVRIQEDLTDDMIIECVFQAYRAHGFTGNVAWHYYNEPMLAWDRIVRLMDRLHLDLPESKFTLWTNGTLLKPETVGLDHLDQIWVTNYQQRDFGWLRSRVPRVTVFAPHLDGRLDKLSTRDERPCLRPFNELIIDHHGNGRLCCMDWRGGVKLGNVFVEGFARVVQQFQQIRHKVAQSPWSPEVPDACRYCPGRQNRIADLVPSVQEITNRDKPWG